MGRKSKLTPEVTKKIADALRAGNYIAPTCQYAGIGETTFHRWMEDGEGDHEAGKDTPEREFWESVKRPRPRRRSARSPGCAAS